MSNVSWLITDQNITVNYDGQTHTLSREDGMADDLIAAIKEDRKEDIPILVNAFIRRLQTKTVKNITGLTPETMEEFMAYQWPGNVRELKSALEYAFVIAEEGLINPDHLPSKTAADIKTGGLNAVLFDSKDLAEKKALIEAVRQSKGNQSQAARILGINRVTVWNRMKKYDIDLKKVMTT